MRSLRAPGNSLCRGAGQRVDADDHDQQHNGRGIGLAAVQALVEQAVHVHRQRAAGFHDTARDAAERTGRKDKGSRLADDAADGQNDAGEDAGHGGRQHDAEHRAQLARAEAEAALAERIGHGLQGLLRRAENRRQDHDGQCERACQHGFVHVQGDDEHQVAEQAVDDGRDAREGLCRKADNLDELIAALGILHKVDGSADAERDGQQQRQHDHEERIDDSGRHGAVVRRIMPGKQARLQVRHAHDEDIGQQRDENGEGDHGRGRDGDALDKRHRMAAVGCAARAPGARFRTFRFFHVASAFRFTAEKHRLMSRMNTNSTTPQAMRASRCRSVA